MKGSQVINQENMAILVFELQIAQTFFSRLRGLLGTAVLPIGKGLLLRPCNSVHTLGMRYPIDVLFLNSDLEVLKIVAALPPMRTVACLSSEMVLELPAGTVAQTNTVVGHRLVCK